MATTHFYLDIKKNRTEQTIFMYFRYGGILLKYNTHFKIEPKFWNKKKQRARETKIFKRWELLNKNLDNLKVITGKIRDEYLLKHSKEPSKEELKILVNESFGRTSEKKESKLIYFIEKHIEASVGKKSEGVIKTYNATLKHLNEYAKSRKKTICFKDIDLHFYTDFTTYLIHEKNLSDNSVGNYIKNIKVFLNAATDKGINKNMAFRDRRFKATKKAADTAVYLTSEELDRLYKMDLSDNLTMSDVRDLFLIGCYTGLRFTDLSKLSLANISYHNGKKVITTTTQKTKERVTIPIHDRVTKILEKRNGQFPKPISIQKTNTYIKKICEQASFDQMIEKTTSRKAKTIKTHVPKYKLVTTHTARRTFATNAYLSGIPIYQVMLITGHKKESTFLQYVRITKKESAAKLDGHDFFNE